MLAVGVLHPMNSVCQKVFAGELDAAWEMINFLIFTHCLKETILERRGGPHDEPIIANWLCLVWQKLVLVYLLILTETVVFKRVLDKLNLYA